MSALITTPLPPRYFELIRDRIGEILFLELDNQSQINYDDNLDAEGWVERTNPFDIKELPAFNVSFPYGKFDGQTMIQTVGQYQYIIDAYTKAPSTANQDGDSEATIRLHRMLGCIQGILEHTIYKRLGFDAPSVNSRHVDEIIINLPEKKGEGDMYSVAHGRLIFTVRIAESSGTVNAVDLSNHTSIVKLALTEKGYKFIYQTP